MSKFKSILLAITLLSTMSSPGYASFDIFDEDSEGYYGNGQTRPFRDAIDNTDSLSSSDRAFLESVQATRVTDRYYARVMVGKSKVVLANLENNSSYYLNSYVLNTTSVGDNLYQLLISGGHMWQQWAIELEAYLSKQLTYFTSPILLGAYPDLSPPASADGTYSNSGYVELNEYALLVNVQYVIPRWFSFYPRRLQIHLDAGVGVAMLITNVTGTSLDATNPYITPTPENTSARTYPAIGMLGVGARYQLAEHILMGVVYRYYNAGKSNYGPVQSVKWTSNQLRSSGFFIDFTYQF